MMYPMRTTFARTAAKPPAYEVLPRIQKQSARATDRLSHENEGDNQRTSEDRVDGDEVAAYGD